MSAHLRIHKNPMDPHAIAGCNPDSDRSRYASSDTEYTKILIFNKFNDI